MIYKTKSGKQIVLTLEQKRILIEGFEAGMLESAAVRRGIIPNEVNTWWEQKKKMRSLMQELEGEQ